MFYSHTKVAFLIFALSLVVPRIHADMYSSISVAQTHDNVTITACALSEENATKIFTQDILSILKRQKIYPIEFSVKNNSHKALILSQNNVQIQGFKLFNKNTLDDAISISKTTTAVCLFLFFPIALMSAYETALLKKLTPVISTFSIAEQNVIIKPGEHLKTIVFIQQDAHEEKKYGAPLYFDMNIQVKDAAQWNLPLPERYSHVFHMHIPNMVTKHNANI